MALKEWLFRVDYLVTQLSNLHFEVRIFNDSK